MNATNYYVSTTRLVLQSDPDNPSTWQDLYRMLPTLRNSLSCTVCEHLLSEPYTPEETTCEHHVCKSCKGGIKKLRPTCSWCKNYSKYSENVQLRLLIQSYKKLCGLIKINKMYGHILRNRDHGPTVRDIISESEGQRINIQRMVVDNIKHEVVNKPFKYNETNEEENVKIETRVDKFEEIGTYEEVEEEIVGECNVSLDCDVRESDEPPDEIISSPLSKMNADTSRRIELASHLALQSVKTSLASSLSSNMSSLIQTTLVPIKSEIKTEPESVVSEIIPTISNMRPNVELLKTTNVKRKIKAEAFILNPQKSKSDLPQFRKIEISSKVITVLQPSKY